MGFEAGEIGRIGGQSAAGGDDGLIAGSKFMNELRFKLAKSWLAVLRKDFCDLFSAALLDEGVGIEQFKLELFGDEAAHGGFARAHETDEGDVGDVAGGGHAHEVADLGAEGKESNHEVERIAGLLFEFTRAFGEVCKSSAFVEFYFLLKLERDLNP